MLHTIIMAGGKGTRFWPLSRKKKAKQYLSIIGDKPLIELTLDRIVDLAPPENRWIVSNAGQAEYLENLNSYLPTDNILLEPMGKNTAPCIGWVATHILAKNPEATLLILPADHFITPLESFHSCVQTGLAHLAEHRHLLTFGIAPTSPRTGYGYIDVQDASQAVCPVHNFKEKPDVDTALSYLQAGTYFWNSGMFMWRADHIVELLGDYMPDNQAILAQICQGDVSLDEGYANLESESIDYAILEKCIDQTAMIKATFSWSDIGSWTALPEFWEKDASNNAHIGQLETVNSSDNIVYSPEKLVGLIGVKDLIVVDSDDAILVADKRDDQAVKTLYDQLDEAYK